MSSKALSFALTRHVVQKRGYANVAESFRDRRLNVTQLTNKTILCALDNGSPVTRVTVAFKAGSRYEPWCELGLTHVLRSSFGMTTANASGFITSRVLAQLGANVTASNDREIFYYTLETTHEHVSEALDTFKHMICGQQFRPWELDDNNPRLKYDLVSIPPQVRAMDLLHKAAFRRGLGNSLFIAPRKIGHIASETLQHYVGTTFAPHRCAIAVVGDNLDQANIVANALRLAPSGEVANENSKYMLGENRKEMGGELAHVALGLEGVSACSDMALPLAIAAKALGYGPVTKWGMDNSPLAKAMGNIGPVAAAGFSVNYEDTGLFGVILSVPKDEACEAVRAANKVLRQGTLTSTAIKAGKNLLKTQILSDGESGLAQTESMAAEALYTGKVRSPLDLADEIDCVPEAKVCQALRTVAQTKLTMGSAGNLAFVPYVDEL